MRTCPDCQRELDESDFYKHHTTGKLYTYCKECTRVKETQKSRMRWELRGIPFRSNCGQPRKYDYNLISDLVRAGFSLKNIAVEVGCSPATVAYVRDRFVSGMGAGK
jgi:hypothetical protein